MDMDHLTKMAETRRTRERFRIQQLAQGAIRLEV
jgi:hypothetical protein